MCHLRRFPGARHRPSETRRIRVACAASLCRRPPPFEELLDADPTHAERFRQMAVAETSLAGHVARDNHGAVGLRKETAPKPAAGNCEKWPRTGRCQMHRTGVPSDKAGGKRDDPQDGQNRGRFSSQVEMNATSGNAARMRSVEGASACCQERETEHWFPMQSWQGPQPNSFSPILDLQARPGAGTYHPVFPVFNSVCRRIERASSSAFLGGSIRAGLRGIDLSRIAEASKRFFSDSGRFVPASTRMAKPSAISCGRVLACVLQKESVHRKPATFRPLGSFDRQISSKKLC